MSIDDKIDEKLEEVTGSDAMLAMYRIIKAYNAKQELIEKQKGKALNFLKESQMYETLGFKVRYYYNPSRESYTFSYEDKEKAGFRR